MELLVEFDTASYSKPSLPPSVNWKKVTGDVRLEYESSMEAALDLVTVPHIVHGGTLCCDHNHVHEIETYYQNIVRAIAKADSILPRTNPSVRKSFWNEELSRLKKESIDANDIWKVAGKPGSGVLFDMKRSAHYRYKAYLRRCQKDSNRKVNESLHEDLLNNDTTKFWKTWKNIHGRSCGGALRVNGCFRDDEIANCFADSFESVYLSNDQVKATALGSKFDSVYSAYYSEHCKDDLSCQYLSWDDMLNVSQKLKVGKATASFIKYEHVLYGSPKLMLDLHVLFNSLIQHAYVPQEFLAGVITPLVKDSESDIFTTSNYRPLTLSVVFASMFEIAILSKIGHLLFTDNLQFGYKSKHSTSHALFVLRSCVDFFTDHGSNVFSAFLDCSKGFDKIDHSGIFGKLIRRGVPLCFVNLIIYWYRNLTSVVRWNGVFSRYFSVTSGVRQGGILSPQLFVLYVDELLERLRRSGAGCHIADVFVGAIMYADDLALLAPTRGSLQKLLDICYDYGVEFCISYNPIKTHVILFGKPTQFESLFLNGLAISAVQECKYLGVNLLAGKEFLCSSRKSLAAFLCSANTILNVLNKPSEVVLMQLLYANCIPILTYCCEIKKFNGREMTSMDVALNNCIRKIFSYNRWESTRALRRAFGYDSVTEIFSKRKTLFLCQFVSYTKLCFVAFTK